MWPLLWRAAAKLKTFKLLVLCFLSPYYRQDSTNEHTNSSLLQLLKLQFVWNKCGKDEEPISYTAKNKSKAITAYNQRCHQLSDLTQSWWKYCISLTMVKKATNTSWLWKWVLWEDWGTGLGFGLHPRPGAWSSSSTSTCNGTNTGAEGLGAEPSPSLTQFSGVPDSRRLGVSG